MIVRMIRLLPKPYQKARESQYPRSALEADTGIGSTVACVADAFYALRNEMRNFLFPVRANANKLLAKICTFKKTHECARCAVEPIRDKLLVLHLALTHPLRHVA